MKTTERLTTQLANTAILLCFFPCVYMGKTSTMIRQIIKYNFNFEDKTKPGIMFFPLGLTQAWAPAKRHVIIAVYF